jgi:hypothetical protein
VRQPRSSADLPPKAVWSSLLTLGTPRCTLTQDPFTTFIDGASNAVYQDLHRRVHLDFGY